MEKVGSNTEGYGAWAKDGKCRPPKGPDAKAPTKPSVDVFFPSDNAGVQRARLVCRSCDVRDVCLEYALTERIDSGVWGGTSERQRRKILKLRKLDAPGIVGSSVTPAKPETEQPNHNEGVVIDLGPDASLEQANEPARTMFVRAIRSPEDAV